MSNRQLKKTPHNYLTSKLVHSKWNFWIHGPNLIFPVSLWLRKWHLHMVNCLSQKFRNCSLFLSFCQSHVESISKVSWLYLQNILPPSSFTTILIITTLGPSIITHLHALPNFATFPCLSVFFSAYIVMLSDYPWIISSFRWEPSLAPYYIWNETGTPWCGWLIHTSSDPCQPYWPHLTLLLLLSVHYSDLLSLFLIMLVTASDVSLIAIFCPCNSFLGRFFVAGSSQFRS